MKSSIILTVAALLMASGGALAPRAALAATDEGPASNRVYGPGGPAATLDSGTRDLEAELEAARLKLEQAAHEVAELSARMGEPVLERTKGYRRGPAARNHRSAA